MNEIQQYQNSGTAMTHQNRQSENTAMVLAAKEKALVEARLTVAMHHPRNNAQLRVDMLAECASSDFAEESWYKVPAGKDRYTGEQKYIEGFSIRFTEAAMQHMRNIDQQTDITLDTENERCIRVTIFDLETNNSLSSNISIEKTVERSYLKDNEEAISVRENSKGRPVYLRKCTTAELAKEQGSVVSKAIRTMLLRIIPPAVKVACQEAILAKHQGGGIEDRNEMLNRIVDGFQKLGIQPVSLEEYLGHSIESISPKELEDLRGIYVGVKDGETDWFEFLAESKIAKNEKAEKNDKKSSMDKAVDEMKK